MTLDIQSVVHKTLLRKIKYVFPRGSITNAKRTHRFCQEVSRKRGGTTAARVLQSRTTLGIDVLFPNPIVQDIPLNEEPIILVREKSQIELLRADMGGEVWGRSGWGQCGGVKRRGARLVGGGMSKGLALSSGGNNGDGIRSTGLAEGRGVGIGSG